MPATTDRDRQEQLRNAASRGDLADVKRLLAAGVSPNARDNRGVSKGYNKGFTA